MGLFKECRKRRKFLKKVRRQLPRFHPDTGQPLNWDITILRMGSKYDPLTGKEIGGYPILSITQKNPGIMVDDHAYQYNWKKKKIERIIGARWSM